MIDWCVNDVWGWGRQRADILTVIFLGTGLGNAMPLPRLFRGIRRMVARPIASLHSSELDIEGHKAAQRNELVVV